MYAAPDSRQAALLGSVAIGRPLERDVDARAFLVDQEPVLLDLELAHAAREIRIARERRQHFGAP
jgi:hypothetical protein